MRISTNKRWVQRQTIKTRFIPPSNVKGSRVSARADAGRIILPWDHALSGDKNHAVAAAELATRLGWCGAWVGGWIGGAAGGGCSFINLDEMNAIAFTITEE